MSGDGVREGATMLALPAGGAAGPTAGPGRRIAGEPFYNPAMALNRDLSVLIAEAEARSRQKGLDVGDALAGTGARAVRIATECAGDVRVHANDADPRAVAALRSSAARNGLPPSRLSVHEGDAHVFLAAGRFDVVDVDPCGSPMPFLDAALRATRRGGLVCLTATDTGALCGTFARACQRRYDAYHGLGRHPWKAEVGLRILAGAVVRSAARAERAAVPVLSVVHGHWMRVVCRVDDGAGRADAARAMLAEAAADEATGGGRFLAPGEPRPAAWAGPLWSGPLHDRAFVDSLRAARAGKEPARARELDPLLALLAAEAAAAPFWIVPDRLQAKLGPPPRRDALIAELTASGHGAARSHVDPQGVRTSAPLAALAEAWPERPAARAAARVEEQQTP